MGYGGCGCGCDGVFAASKEVTWGGLGVKLGYFPDAFLWRIFGMSYWEDTLRQTQNFLEGSHFLFDLGDTLESPRRIWEV